MNIISREGALSQQRPKEKVIWRVKMIDSQGQRSTEEQEVKNEIQDRPQECQSDAETWWLSPDTMQEGHRHQQEAESQSQVDGNLSMSDQHLFFTWRAFFCQHAWLNTFNTQLSVHYLSIQINSSWGYFVVSFWVRLPWLKYRGRRRDSIGWLLRS